MYIISICSSSGIVKTDKAKSAVTLILTNISDADGKKLLSILWTEKNILKYRHV